MAQSGDAVNPHEASEMGRDDPYPCGTGKKYKRLMPREAEEALRPQNSGSRSIVSGYKPPVPE
jgi:hypothetical protein